MPEPGTPFSGRLVALLAAAVAAVALIGLVTGTSPSTYRAKRAPSRERPNAGLVPPARSHAELERRPWGDGPADSSWNESREVAARAEVREEPDEKTAALAMAQRAARRAFDGAPPVIPHPVRAGGAAECLACHAEGFALAGLRASPVPHAGYASCTQCHVSSSASFTLLEGNAAADVETSWRGQPSANGGIVAYPGAPPAVSHSTWMRERCESCHGPEGRAKLQTPHPDRRSCLQCHPATGGRAGASSR